ncbi:MAG: hypothetical protein Q8K79_20580 [Solirubrobacteraceae bacterium]|nr:hypothetical protein [Solirubrobacteraceae bacterium]
MPVHHVATGVELLALTDVGLAVSDRGAMARFLCGHLGLHELDRTPDRVVLGAAERAATLSLVAAGGPRRAAAAGRLVLRVADVERAAAALPAATVVEGDRIERAAFAGPEGIGLGFALVAGGGIDYDVDHVLLRVADPNATRVAFAEAGFVPRARALHVADKYISLAASAGGGERPLLRHIGLRVDSVEAVAATARARGLPTDEPGTDGALTVVLPGPERIRLRFAE